MAKDHGADLVGRDAGALDGGAGDHRRQLDRRHRRKAAAKGADRRACTRQNDYFIVRHGFSPRISIEILLLVALQSRVEKSSMLVTLWNSERTDP